MAADSPKPKTWCDHLAFLSSHLTGIPSRQTPCKRCQNPSENWFCLCCKDVLCSRYANKHMLQHYQQTNHCLSASCSDQSIWCYSCNAFLDAQVIPQLRAFLSASKDLSSSSKLEDLDSLIVDVIDLISKPFPSFDLHPLGTQSFVGQDEVSLAKEGLQKIFYHGLEALADPQVQQEFLAYSATLLLFESCPSDLKVTLSSFRGNLSEETSAFLQAQYELKVASDLSASITQKKFVLRQQTSKYAELKKQVLASNEKVTNLKAMIEELEAQIKRLETCLATDENNRVKIYEDLDPIETRVTTVKEGLVSDLAQASAIEGTTQAANQLVARRQSEWDSLRTAFTKFA